MHDIGTLGLNAAYQGARWLRTDLHLHSPGAFSFAFPPDLQPDQDKDEIVRRYVKQLSEQRITVAAITDYQCIRAEWFVPIRDLARERGITVFPGVELSFKGPKHGLHILAIFGYDADPDSINRAVHALDRVASSPLVNPKDGKHRDIDPEKSIKDALRRLRGEMPTLLIAAHPTDSNGLFKSYSPKDAAELLTEVGLDAIESFSEADKKRLVSTGVCDKATLDHVAGVEFTDPKAIDEIGRKARPSGHLRTTYLKLSAANDLDSLYLALHDPEVMVCTDCAPSIDYTHLVGLQVDGNGFLHDFIIALSPELNVMVGGRGVGKSAVLETIRYVLDLPAYGSNDYRDNLVRYALGVGGKAAVYVEQVLNHDVRRWYRFERVWGESPRVFELDPEREVSLAPLEVLGDREAPLFFGQREIYELTRNEGQRLRLLDEIIGRQARDELVEVKRLEDHLRENARAILEAQRELGKRQEIEQRIREIRHDIELYNRLGLAKKLREATTLASDEQRLTNARSTLTQLESDWSVSTAGLLSRWQGILKQLAGAESSQSGLLLEARQILLEVESQLSALLRDVEECLTVAQDRLAEVVARWQEARKPLDEAMRLIKQELGNQTLDPDRLIRLTTEETDLMPQLEALDQVQSGLEQLETRRRELLTKLRNARRNVWKLRNKQAQGINRQLQGRVRVAVDYKGQRAGFAERLTAFFQGSGVDKKSIERIAQAQDSVDGATIAEEARKGLQALEARFGLTTARAQQMHSFLSQEAGRLYDIELLTPDDAVQVYLRLNDVEQPLATLSDGQRATAMLLLLLIQEDRLLLVDQPEDDLDNRFVYDDIVRILREQKVKRQLIAATHNPNIPVLGNAELIAALEATDSRATISAQGAIDSHASRDFVRNVMEGGEDAFRRRAQKYGWLRKAGEADHGPKRL